MDIHISMLAVLFFLSYIIYIVVIEKESMGVSWRRFFEGDAANYKYSLCCVAFFIFSPLFSTGSFNYWWYLFSLYFYKDVVNQTAFERF